MKLWMNSSRYARRLLASSVAVTAAAALQSTTDRRLSLPVPAGPFRNSLTRCDALPNDDFTDSFEPMIRPERTVRTTHAIFGVLHGDGMIEEYMVYKRRNATEGDSVVLATVRFGTRVDGHPGVVHGGILSLLLDDVFGFGFGAIGVRKAFTANLTVDYRAPVPAGTRVRIQVQLDRREGRKLFWRGQVTSMDGSVLFAEATSLYVIPRDCA